MTDGIDHGLDAAVAERQRLLRGGQLLGQGEILFAPALGCHHHLHGGALARPGVADVDPAASQVGQLADARITACHQREGLAVQRHHRPQFAVVGIHELEGPALVNGVVLPVRLGQAELDGAAAHVAQIEQRSRRGDGAAFQLAAGAVDEPADGAADRVVDAGPAAAADQDLLGPRGRTKSPGESERQDKADSC